MKKLTHSERNSEELWPIRCADSIVFSAYFISRCVKLFGTWPSRVGGSYAAVYDQRTCGVT